MAQVGPVLDRLLEGELLDAQDVARVVGSTARSVARWQSEDSAPRRGAEERLLELKAVVELLRSVLRDEPARLWLRSPNRDLDWQKPLDLVRAGEYRRVIGVVLAMAEGITA